jgi:phosphoglucomutase
LINVVKKGQQGEQEIKAMMEKFRAQAPSSISGIPVTRMLDYKTLTETNLETKQTKPLNFPNSDVLQFYLEDGSKISVRPSGTEPKIKFYVSVNTALRSPGEFDKANAALEAKIKSIEDYLMAL